MIKAKARHPQFSACETRIGLGANRPGDGRFSYGSLAASPTFGGCSLHVHSRTFRDPRSRKTCRNSVYENEIMYSTCFHVLAMTNVACDQETRLVFGGRQCTTSSDQRSTEPCRNSVYPECKGVLKLISANAGPRTGPMVSVLITPRSAVTNVVSKFRLDRQDSVYSQ